MSGQRPRPWWASVPGVDELDPDQDPVEVARDARRPRTHHGSQATDTPRPHNDRTLRSEAPSDPDVRADPEDGPSGPQDAQEDPADLQDPVGRHNRSQRPGEAAETRHEGHRDDDGSSQSRCSFPCPLCTGWRTLADHHPEVVDHLAAAARHVADIRPEVADHLMAAGHHLLAALRAVVDDLASDERPERSPFERIDLDDTDPREGP
mgnify:CR=1 FL=1